MRTLFMSLFLAFFFPLMGEAEGFPLLRNSHAIESEHIYLGDLFKNLAAEKAALIIDAAPALGRVRSYNEKDLAIIAMQYHVNWQPQAGEKIEIYRTARVIDKKILKQLVMKRLAKKLGSQYVSVELERDDFTLYLPPQNKDAIELVNFRYDPQTKKFHASFSFVGKGDFKGPYHFSGKVIDTMEVPVLNRPVQPGEIIDEDDIDKMQMHISQLRKDTYIRAKDMLGKTPQGVLRPYVPIKKRQLHFPLLVKKNEIITVLYEKENIHITSKGKALEDGAMGDVIRVMNLTSKKVIQAELIGPKKARVSGVG